MKKQSTKEKIDELMESVNEKKETVIILSQSDGTIGVNWSGDKQKATALIATIVNEGLRVDDEGMNYLANSIVDGVGIILSSNHSENGLKVAKKLAAHLSLGLKNRIERLEKQLFEEDDDEDDDEEDCSTCRALKFCQEPNAIKYRKEHGIPAPRNADKRRKGSKVKSKDAN